MKETKKPVEEISAGDQVIRPANQANYTVIKTRHMDNLVYLDIGISGSIHASLAYERGERITCWTSTN